MPLTKPLLLRLLGVALLASTAEGSFAGLRGFFGLAPRDPPVFAFPDPKFMESTGIVDNGTSFAAARDLLEGKRQSCASGYGYCSCKLMSNGRRSPSLGAPQRAILRETNRLTRPTAFGRCCPLSAGCCGYGYCIDKADTCCPNGPCGPGKTCCGYNHCMPTTGQCCADESYCEQGNHCYLVTGVSRPVCCTNNLCTAYVTAGTTVSLTTTVTRPPATVYFTYYYTIRW